MKWKRIVEAVLRILWALRLVSPPPAMRTNASGTRPEMRASHLLPAPADSTPAAAPTKSASAQNAERRAAVTFGPNCSNLLPKSLVLYLLRSDCHRSTRKIDTLVLHCTDTRPSQAYTIEQLAKDHQRRGFGQYPGYHVYVRRDGTLYYCRPANIKGCHAKGYNAHSIGVCYEGGRSDSPEYRHEDNRTAEQMVVLREVFTALREACPGARIVGHSELNPNKACPCLSPPASVEYRDI